MVTLTLSESGLLNCPKWLPASIQYETQMGSTVYGASDDASDMDIYGFCIPPREILFPHFAGDIPGFGRQKQTFSNYQEHHIQFMGKSWDLDIYSINRYFDLVMGNNPNMVDSLFTKRRFVEQTTIGGMVRERRTLFLHKGCLHKYNGYAYQQLRKLESRDPTGSRKELIDRFGYDVKHGYHLARLLDECEQILLTGDIDLERSAVYLRAIRTGQVAKEDLVTWANKKLASNNELYHTSTLRHTPDEKAIRQLLIDCLEEYYGQNYVHNEV